MKPSKRNLANASAKSAKIKGGPPRQSKYDIKVRGLVIDDDKQAPGGVVTRK